MDIAIVGSGIAGLCAAWLLGQKHKVTLYERHSFPGMGAFNLDYRKDGVEERIDVPLRAFNAVYYKNLMAFYKTMGVEIRRTDHAASYTLGSEFSKTNKAEFSYRYMTFGNRAVPIFAAINHINLKSLMIAKDAAKFLLFARRDRAKGRVENLSIDDYLTQKGYSTAFKEDVLLPSFAAICTCSYSAIKQYPAELIIDFLASGMLFDGIWRAKHGAEDAIDKMLSNCHELKCKSQITAVERRGEKVCVREDKGQEQLFDHVVIASQANQALSLLPEDEFLAKELLARVPYEKSEVIVHGDEHFAPQHESDRAPVNFLVDKSKEKIMASIQLNDIYPSLKESDALFQTWNPLFEPEADTILGRSYFERPVVNLDSLDAINHLQKLHGQAERKIWYCGSYAMPGIPLLESAVQSAMVIANKLGCSAPWESSLR